jgi:hypothetical protein
MSLTLLIFLSHSHAAINGMWPDAYWVAAENAPLYDKPGGTPQTYYPWASRIMADLDRLKTAPQGWVPIRASESPPSYMWFRREDLWDAKPKKVVACWPIKRIEYTAGDWALEINFKPDGSGVAREFDDVPEENLSPYKTHAYMSQNIVRFVALNKDKRFFFTAGYKPEERQLYPDGSKGPITQTLFDESELTGCTSRPVLKK